MFGELRPHFLDTCRPDALQTCTGGYVFSKLWLKKIVLIFFVVFLFCRQYVVDYKCTNDIDSSWFVRDASKSFPSGHSSTSFFEAVFLIWWVLCCKVSDCIFLKQWNSHLENKFCYLNRILAFQRIESCFCW